MRPAVTLYECGVCGQRVTVPSDAIVACEGRRGAMHPLANLRVVQGGDVAPAAQDPLPVAESPVGDQVRDP